MIVVLTNRDRYFRGWAAQFVAHDQANRDMRVLANIATAQQSNARRNIDTHYRPAIERAGRGGTLIISVGHGGTAGGDCDGAVCFAPTDTRIGMVDLLPSGALRIQSQNVFYHNRESDEGTVDRADEIGSRQCQTLARRYSLTDTRRYPPDRLALNLVDCSGAAGARQRLEIRAAYDRIGELLREFQVSNVTFLTCRVGNSQEFLDRIASDWGVTITAYQRRVAAIEDSEGLMRVYLEGDSEGRGTNTDRARHEVPNVDRYVTGSRSRAGATR